MVHQRQGGFPFIPILYEDEGMVVVNKPSGLAVHRGHERSRHHLMAYLKKQLKKWIWPIHRLDGATSGVVVMGLSEEAARALNAFFRGGKTKKIYLAWVRGIPSPREGVINHPVPRSAEDPRRIPASTHYRTLEVAIDPRTGKERYALVWCEPETGRYHQLRLHLRHIHCPILGDTSHGDGKENRAMRALCGLHRLALHAIGITIPHWAPPHSLMGFFAPIPEDLRIPMIKMGIGESALRKIEEATAQALGLQGDLLDRFGSR
ncbi:MAG: pseudouridine synthase [Sandaracinaceae bacterium]|nr:pseudouridine synthase [Sandaracinaceae bacterium]MDW8245628.1 pseudouridine synthase [Sandaracinaceae bacterium]